MPKTKSPEESNARQRREMFHFLSNPGGFRLGILDYDEVSTRDREVDALVEALREAAAPVCVSRLEVNPGENALLHRLEEHLAEPPPGEGRRSVFVVGLETALDYRAEGGRGLEIFENANLQRDAYAGLGPVSVVLCLDFTASTTFFRTAPDLWRWNTGIFSFVAPKPRQPVHERLTVRPWSPGDGVLQPSKLRVAMLEKQLSQNREARSVAERSRHVALLNELALAHHQAGNSSRAGKLLSEAVALSQEIGDRSGEASALELWGTVRTDLGDTSAGERSFVAALGVARELGDTRLERRLLAELFANAYVDGLLERAARWLEDSSQLPEVPAEDRDHAGDRLNGTLIAAHEGRTDDAAESGVRALETFREIGDRHGEGTALLVLGFVLSRDEDLVGGLRATSEAVAVFRGVGDPLGEGLGLANLAVLHDAVAQPAPAEAARRRAARIAAEHPALERLRRNPAAGLDLPAAESRSPSSGERRGGFVVAPSAARGHNAAMPQFRRTTPREALHILQEAMAAAGLSETAVEKLAGMPRGWLKKWFAAPDAVALGEYLDLLRKICEYSPLEETPSPAPALPPSFAETDPDPNSVEKDVLREPGALDVYDLDFEAMNGGFWDVQFAHATLVSLRDRDRGLEMIRRFHFWGSYLRRLLDSEYPQRQS